MLYPTKKSTVQVQSSTTNFKRRIEEEVVGVGRMDNNNYKEEIKKAKVVFMKGTAGECALKPFCKGTKEILKTISRSLEKELNSFPTRGF